MLVSFHLIKSCLFSGIRTALLDSEEHVCFTCKQSDVSPDNLIANKFLRQVTLSNAYVALKVKLKYDVFFKHYHLFFFT